MAKTVKPISYQDGGGRPLFTMPDTYRAFLTRDGRMTIPAPIRQRLGLTPERTLPVGVSDDGESVIVTTGHRRTLADSLG
ncbi:MAG: AbrB/MazE/SpoVT family DNA-binding domain-containing protein [Dehalococcoidia bacterium]